VRCARDNPDDSQSSCKHCITLGIPCTYDYQPKKRGPPNLYGIAASLTCSSLIPDLALVHHHRYLRRLQEAAAAAAAQQQLECQMGESTSPLSARPSLTSPRQSTSVPISNMSQSTSTFLDQSLNGVGPVMSSGSLQSSRFPITTDGYQTHYQQMTSPSFGGSSVDTQRSPKVEDSSSFMSSPEQFSTYPLYNWSFRQHQPAPPPSTLPPLSYYYRSHSLEEVAPRDTIMLIIALFFDFVYPLSPCVHKPSYMADLRAHREERDPLFFALVMSTVASTLVQLPRSYLPMGRHTVRKLAQTCHEASRHISVASYDPPTSMHVVIRYLWVSPSLEIYT
jgi:hypothetical protein